MSDRKNVNDHNCSDDAYIIRVVNWKYPPYREVENKINM